MNADAWAMLVSVLAGITAAITGAHSHQNRKQLKAVVGEGVSADLPPINAQRIRNLEERMVRLEETIVGQQKLLSDIHVLVSRIDERTKK